MNILIFIEKWKNFRKRWLWCNWGVGVGSGCRNNFIPVNRWALNQEMLCLLLLLWVAAAAAKSLQSCPTLYDPVDGSPSGSPIPGILQARTLEGVAISFSNAWKRKVKGKLLSRVGFLISPLLSFFHNASRQLLFFKHEKRVGFVVRSITAGIPYEPLGSCKTKQASFPIWVAGLSLLRQLNGTWVMWSCWADNA